MTNRRDFLKTAAGVAAVAAGFDRFPAHAQTPPAGSLKRREVFVGRRRAMVVDVHRHFIEPPSSTSSGHESRRQYQKQPEQRARVGRRIKALDSGASTSGAQPGRLVVRH